MTFFSPVLDELAVQSLLIIMIHVIMNAPGYLKGQCHDDITGSGQFCAEVVT